MNTKSILLTSLCLGLALCGRSTPSFAKIDHEDAVKLNIIHQENRFNLYKEDNQSKMILIAKELLHDVEQEITTIEKNIPITDSKLNNNEQKILEIAEYVRNEIKICNRLIINIEKNILIKQNYDELEKINIFSNSFIKHYENISFNLIKIKKILVQKK